MSASLPEPVSMITVSRASSVSSGCAQHVEPGHVGQRQIEHAEHGHRRLTADDPVEVGERSGAGADDLDRIGDPLGREQLCDQRRRRPLVLEQQDRRHPAAGHVGVLPSWSNCSESPARRPGEVVALADVAAERAQLGEVRRRLEPLGDHLQSELTDHRDDRPGKRPRARRISVRSRVKTRSSLTPSSGSSRM